MSEKPRITGVPGNYRCEDAEGFVGYGRTPLEAFRNMESVVRPEAEYAPGLRKIVEWLYGRCGK